MRTEKRTKKTRIFSLGFIAQCNKVRPMSNTNRTHQINETHIGDNTTPDEARLVVEALQSLGVSCEYTPLIGAASYVLDEDGEQIFIPQNVWDEALTVLTH